MIGAGKFRGRIYAGKTSLANTIKVVQTGPLELTVKAGKYTRTDGTEFVLAADQTFIIVPDLLATKTYRGELGLMNGVVDVRLYSYLDSSSETPPPVGWQALEPYLILPFNVPPATLDLTNIKISALTVLPGFPPENDDESWKEQV